MPFSGFAQFQVPTRIIMCPGIAADMGTEWSQLGVSRPLICSDAGVVAAGIVDTVEQSLRDAGAEITGRFIDIPPNSDVTAVNAVVQCARESGADAIVAIGGGSVIDTAKLAACLHAHGGTVHDYAGAQTLPGPITPLVVVPTTAGTGSEVSQAAVVYDPESQRKLSFIDENLRPRLAVLDPVLTVSLPTWLTAATGMDACVHAVEAYVGVQNGVFADACAVQALHLIRQYLQPALTDGSDVQARAGMMSAATLAGIAFDHSMVGVVHAMSHAVGALTKIHHGHANAILLPLGMEYNQSAVLPRYAALARKCGVSHEADDFAAFQELKAWTQHCLHMCHDLSTPDDDRAHRFPRTLHDAGIDKALIPRIAEVAAEDGAGFYNPRPVEADAIAELLTLHWGDS